MQYTNKLTNFIYPALFAALIIALGFIFIPLPISPVPISGISLGVMLAGSILNPKQAFYSVLTVILLGAVGLPVFSGFTGGIGTLLGPRGGYYLGFLIGATVIAILKKQDNCFWQLFLINVLGAIVIAYCFAVPWLSFVTGMSIEQSFIAGAVPFFIGDLLKAFIASMIALALNKHIGKK